MNTHSSLLRLGLVLSLGLTTQVSGAQFYFTSKSHRFVQTSGAGSFEAPNGAFTFRAEAPTAVTLAFPGGNTIALPRSSGDDVAYALDGTFSTKAGLDAAYPMGTYRMTGTGIPELPFNFTADAYPAATPQIIGGNWNSGGLLVLNPAQANTINFSNFTDYGIGGIAGHMRVDLSSMTPGGNSLQLEEEIATQSVFGLTARSTPLTSYTILAGTLVSGQAYRLDVQFDTLTTLDSTTIPDGGVVAMQSKRVTVYIAAQNPGTSTTPPVITTQPTNQQGPLGSSVTFAVGVSTGGAEIDFNATSTEWYFNGARVENSGRYSYGGSPGIQTLTINNLTAGDVGSYSLTVINVGGIVTSSAASYVIGPAAPPVFSAQPRSTTVGPGGSTQLNATVSGASSYQWQRNGSAIEGATSSSLFLSGLTTAGLYTVVATNSAGSTTSLPAIVAVATSSRLDGAATEAGSNILHPVTGNTYDQFLLTGASATVMADPGQVTRLSFIDLNDDIVQVEFAGAGRVSVSLDNLSGPDFPVKYNQGITYMKGHATIIVSGANETTNLSVFSVGRGNAVNQALFKDVSYDSHADVAVVAVMSANGLFGGARTANASYFNTKGITGFYAPGVQFQGPVFVNDISAYDNARPVYIIGGGPDVRVTGGDLLQANGRPVAIDGISELKFTAGTNSKGELEAAQANRGRLEQNGQDITNEIVRTGSQ